jgi:hypothetical protein
MATDLPKPSTCSQSAKHTVFPRGFRTSCSRLALLPGTPAPCHLTIVRFNSRLQRLGLRPRRHAEHKHLTQVPHPIGQRGRHPNMRDIRCRKKTWSIFGPFGSLTFIDTANMRGYPEI